MKHGERWLLAAVFLVVGIFDVWTVRSSGDRWKFGLEQRDYYNFTIDGWLEGHLDMAVDIPPALLKIADPYDPAQRPKDLPVLHDASFYKGKYYIYFGVGPIATLMFPFRLLTGTDLPQAVAVLIFVYLGFVASAVLWLSMRRRYFPETGALVAALGVLALGVAGLGPMLLRRTHMWELPIGAGYCYAMITLLCVWQSLHAKARGRMAWFAGAGLALGLAVASRPTYLLASPLLAVPLLWWWRAERRTPWRVALAAVVPMAVVGALLALHNYERFDNPLEFGQRYQFSLDYEAKMVHFSPTYAGWNVWRYFFSAAQWSSYFPFIAPAELPPKPLHYGGHDDVYGVLVNLPLAWLALAAPLAAWRRSVEERGRLHAWLGAAAVVFAVMAGVLLCFFGSLARYEMDFTPTLMLLACVGVLAVERALSGRMRSVARVAWGGALMFSVLFGFLFSLQLNRLLRERNPALERDVARLLNRVPAAFEALAGTRRGPVELTVRLPAGAAAGAREPLLTTGRGTETDEVFVQRLDAKRAQLGFVHYGGATLLSRPLEVDFAVPHRVRVASGGLLPPDVHPFFSGATEREIAALVAGLRIEFDGEPVIVERQRFHEAGAGAFVVGRESTANGGAGRKFSGEIVAVKREGGSAAALARAGGEIFRWRVESHNDAAGVGASAVHELELHVGQAGAGRKLWLRRDGVIAWSHGAVEAPADVAQAAVVAGIEGTVFQAERFAADADPLRADFGPVTMTVMLPRERTGRREPLVGTGQTGRGDMLVVEYVDAETVRFGFDHWGSAPVFSAPVRVDFAQPHEIAVAVGALLAPSPAGPQRVADKGALKVSLDGRVVWETKAEYYLAAAADVEFARNGIGSSVCDPRFTGAVRSVTRGTGAVR